MSSRAQQLEIYVDPGYEGRGRVPLGLDSFRIQDGILSIVASRAPPELKQVLYNSEYVSGILTTQESFSQKYGYFEFAPRLPLGVGVWPAFWMLANDGGWPPEIDALGGRGQRPGDVVMTTHGGFRQQASCSIADSISPCRMRPSTFTTMVFCGSVIASCT